MTLCPCARRRLPRILCLLTTALASLATTGRLTAQLPIVDSLSLPFVPMVRFDPDFGLLVGGRAVLFDGEIGRSVVQGGIATSGRFLYTSHTDLGRPGPDLYLTVDARISGITPQRFYGFGNATTADRHRSYFRTDQYQYQVEPKLTMTPSASTEVSVGPVLKYTNTGSDLDGPHDADLDDVDLVRVTRPYGSGWFGQLGAQARASLGIRSGQSRRALRLAVGGSLYPAVLDATAPFGELHGEVAGSAHLPLPTTPVLAVRMGAKKVWGTMPIHEAAFLGGSSSLRGFSRQRFAGDAAVFGDAELRVPIGQIDVFGPMSYGVFGLTDAGRVYYEGASPGGWHTAVGGGVWIAPALPAHHFSLAVVRSSEGISLHLGAGLGY